MGSLAEACFGRCHGNGGACKDGGCIVGHAVGQPQPIHGGRGWACGCRSAADAERPGKRRPGDAKMTAGPEQLLLVRGRALGLYARLLRVQRRTFARDGQLIDGTVVASRSLLWDDSLASRTSQDQGGIRGRACHQRSQCSPAGTPVGEGAAAEWTDQCRGCRRRLRCVTFWSAM